MHMQSVSPQRAGSNYKNQINYNYLKLFSLITIILLKCSKSITPFELYFAESFVN